MGVNIAGVVINRRYKDNVAGLEKILGEKLVFDKEVPFEEASENWKKNTYCDVYYSDSGTLVFLSFESAGFDFPVKDQETFSFVLSEMSMAFSVNYTRNGEVLRTILESEGEIHQNEGIPFEYEGEQEDRPGLIHYLFEKTLGIPFFEIDPAATCYRYTFKRSVFNVIEEIPEPLIDPALDPSESFPGEEEAAETKKPWWKIW